MATLSLNYPMDCRAQNEWPSIKIVFMLYLLLIANSVKALRIQQMVQRFKLSIFWTVRRPGLIYAPI
jgi:hypothetical protein